MITIHVFFFSSSFVYGSSFVSVCFCDPAEWTRGSPPRRRWRTGLDLRDRWVGPAATCSSRSVRQQLSVSGSLQHTHTHSNQSVTHPVTLIQKHKCIHSHTAIHPKQSALLRCPAKGETCSDTQFKSYCFSTETDATVCIYILCFFKIGFIRNESVYQYDFAVLVDE